MPWYGYLLLGVLLLIVFYPFLITRKNIKILQRVGSYIISALPRTGKSALACCLAQKHNGRVVSPIPIKVRNEFSYCCSYDDVFKFNQLNSNYVFKERDMVVLDELDFKINNNDLSPEFKETQESLWMFCKTKKIIKRGETMTFSLWFPSSYLQRYNSRALNYIHSLKSELSNVKDYEQSQSLEFTVDDIRAVGLDKLDNLLQDNK